MKESRGHRDGGWRIRAPLIGSVTIWRSILLRATVGVLIFSSACGGYKNSWGGLCEGERDVGEAQESGNPDPEERARENARFEERAAKRDGSLHGGVDDIDAEKLRKKGVESQLDRAVAPEKKIPNADNAGEALDFIKANLEGKQPEGRDPWIVSTPLWTNTPERAYERAVERYGEANAQAAYAAWGRTPPSVKAQPSGDTAPKPGASPDVKLYSELPPEGTATPAAAGDAVVTVTHGPLPSGWAPNEEMQKAMRVPENTLLFLSNTTPGLFDTKTNTTHRTVIPIIVGPTKASEADFGQGRTGFWPPLQPGSFSATQLGPSKALLMQIPYGSGSLVTRYYYVPLTGGWSVVIYVSAPGTDNLPPEEIAQGEVLVNEAVTIAQGLRFQVNGKPAP